MFSMVVFYPNHLVKSYPWVKISKLIGSAGDLNLTPRVYLAGPDVFLPNAIEVGRRKKDICSKYHLDAFFPLDAELRDRDAGISLSSRIYGENIKLIEESSCVIANASPFRGVSMDVGTAYEIGFARALQKEVFIYSNISLTYAERVEKYSTRTGIKLSNKYSDLNGYVIENFELEENLMISECAREYSNGFFTNDLDIEEDLSSFYAFEDCVRYASNFINNYNFERKII